MVMQRNNRQVPSGPLPSGAQDIDRCKVKLKKKLLHTRLQNANVKMKQIIKKIPIVNSIARSIYRKLISQPRSFPGSKNYWIERYDSGMNSGAGSYIHLAEFKAEIINDFIKEKNIEKVIEYGCGDGNQLKLMRYSSYIGFDISPKAVSMCKEAFHNDASKAFKVMDGYNNESAGLTLSLDVVFHLIEDDVFLDYMNRLFDSSEQFVIIYSSDTNLNPEKRAHHVKHRKFSEWVSDTKPEWRLAKHIPNRYPFNDDLESSSFCDFFIYERA